MARKKSKYEMKNLYDIVEKLHKQYQEDSKKKKFYNFRDPVALRALFIHRHLKALETDILEHAGKKAISLSSEPNSDQIIISIRKEDVHCSRVAYLTPYEFRLLRKNRKVANVLRKCPAYKDVA